MNDVREQIANYHHLQQIHFIIIILLLVYHLIRGVTIIISPESWKKFEVVSYNSRPLLAERVFGESNNSVEKISIVIIEPIL